MSAGRSLRDKALVAIAEERVRVIRANESGIAVDVTSSRPDRDTLARPVWRAVVWIAEGKVNRSCTCPSVRRCNHLEAAELLWAPGPHDRSER